MKIIKKEIVIDAPASKVWEHITDSKKIAGWFKPNTFEARVGAAFTIECHAEDGIVSGIVKEIVPQKKLVYTFRSNMTRVETLVTITLASEGKSTRLTLVHSGWDALPPEEQNISDQFEGGWGGFLKNLQETARK
ncbi:MAG TPA: SRPBCC domain-containing protein [Candidatus Acidoferrum sp.]|nr:SRPBCC domain-containing protein [Candidatus Acidoferrum sp.]